MNAPQVDGVSTAIGEPDVSRQAVLEWLTSRIAEMAGVDVGAIDGATDIVELGLDSMALYNLTGEVAQWLKRDIPATLFWDHTTLESIASALCGDPSTRDWRHLMPLNKVTTGTPMLCTPGLGGHAIAFRGLAERIGNHPVYGVSVLPLGTKWDQAVTLNSISEVVREIVKEVLAAFPDGPIILVGHSFGGLIAYELAQQLLAAGRTIEHLIMLDGISRESPRKPFRLRLVSHLRHLCFDPIPQKWAYAKGLLGNLRRRLSGVKKQQGGQSDQSFKREIHVSANRAAVDYQRMLWCGYEAKTIPMPIILFRAEIPEVWNDFYFIDPYHGWGELTEARIDFHPLDLPHGTMLDEPNVAVLAEVLIPIL
ncbi:MAG: alpha/beta fold hydrolase [Phycisphaera sp.]|nr:alpha/beta fold hydrolase [Phycisphaera sp.]